MINITPLYDRVIVEPVETVDQKSTILVVQEKTKLTGRVVEVGQGYLVDGVLVPLFVGKDDLVLYPAYASVIEYPYNGKKYVIIKESDIIGIIKE